MSGTSSIVQPRKDVHHRDELFGAIGVDLVDDRLRLLGIEDRRVGHELRVDPVLDAGEAVTDRPEPGLLRRYDVGVLRGGRLCVGDERRGFLHLLRSRLVIEVGGQRVLMFA